MMGYPFEIGGEGEAYSCGGLLGICPVRPEEAARYWELVVFQCRFIQIKGVEIGMRYLGRFVSHREGVATLVRHYWGILGKERRGLEGWSDRGFWTLKQCADLSFHSNNPLSSCPQDRLQEVFPRRGVCPKYQQGWVDLQEPLT